jgi:hypothetical protein
MDKISIELPSAVTSIEEEVNGIKPSLVSLLRRLDRILDSSHDIRKESNGNYLVRDLGTIKLAIQRSLVSLDQISPSARRIHRISRDLALSEMSRGKTYGEEKDVRNGSKPGGEPRGQEATTDEPGETGEES